MAKVSIESFDNRVTKQTRGRQKIEIKRIENEDDRLITISKRKSSIYKKNELATLYEAEIGVVTFSPLGKSYLFAHPSIDPIANGFFNRNFSPQHNDNTHAIMEAHRKVMLDEMNQ